MPRAVEQSHRIAELAIGALKQLSLAATPRNIEVWYAHVEGRNPALSRDIQKCQQLGGELTQKHADDLYERFILRTDLSTDVIELVAKFENEITALTDVIEASGESAHGHGERLQTLSKELHQSATESPAVGALLESVINVTKAIREENQQLERRLAESSDEIVTLRHNVEHIQLEAMLDPLTGIKNRKTFDAAIATHVQAAKEQNSSLALILADIDFFKTFNDRWGHQTGDQVLRLVAEVMNANVKGQDILARYGGEEFAIILPGTCLENAGMLADRIRQAVEARRLKKRRTGEDLGVVTMSMGVAEINVDDTIETLIERADICLYAAKGNGRNCVVDEDSLPMQEKTVSLREDKSGAA